MSTKYRVIKTIRGPEFYKIEKQVGMFWIEVCDCYGMSDVEATIDRIKNKVVKEFYA